MTAPAVIDVESETTTAPATATFKLDASPMDEVKRLHGEIVSHAHTSLEKAIRIGELMTAEKARHKHGKWMEWVEANTDIPYRTIARYMELYAGRSKFATVANIELNDAYKILAKQAKLEKPAKPTAEFIDEMKIRGKRQKLNFSTLQKVWQGTQPHHRRRFVKWLRQNKQTYNWEWSELVLIED